MSANAFVDTNILVYAFAETGDYRHAKAAELIDSLLAGDGASLSVQVLREFYAVVTGKLKKPLPRKKAIELIGDLGSAFRVLEDTLPQLERSLELARNISIWDASIIAAAEAGGCTAIYTEDIPSRTVIGNIRVINPFKDSLRRPAER